VTHGMAATLVASSELGTSAKLYSLQDSSNCQASRYGATDREAYEVSVAVDHCGAQQPAVDSSEEGI
jgi:hypothetical protein